MTTSLYDIEQLPTTSQAAIRAFDDRYIAGSGAVEPPTWVTLGDVADVDSPMTTFPISSLGVKYQKTSGQNRFKTMEEKSFDIKTEEFDDGIEAPLMQLFTSTYAYRKWLQGPARLLNAEMRFRNRAIATLLEAGTTTVGWDGEFFFDTDHPANFADASKGTFSNYQASTKAITIANLEAEVTLMMGVLDEQGEKMNVSPDTILVPTAKYEATKNLLTQTLIATGSTNTTAAVDSPYKGKFNIIHVPELTDADDWYLVDSALLTRGLPPWIVLKYRAAASLGLRNYDESSDFFKDTGHIKVSSHIWYGTALGFSHAIRLIKGA